MESSNKIFKVIKSKGVMRASELAPYVSTRAQLRRHVESGQLITLGSGFYAHPSLDPFAASVLAVAIYYPKAVISNISSLVIHGLSDERIDRIDVDIPRTSSIRNKLICAHRVPKKHLIGITKLTFQNHKIRIYSRERALCEAYSLDPEGPIFLKAIKRYVKSEIVDIDQVSKFDKALRTNVLRSLTQELANG